MTVLIAWHTHWTSLLQILPDSTAIKFNTAVCFILCSVGILLLTTRCERFAIVCGSFAIVIATVTLLEYLTSLPIDIDQLFVRDYIFFPLDFPGRMAQLTAGCFTLLGVALSLAAEPRRRNRQVFDALELEFPGGRNYSPDRLGFRMVGLNQQNERFGAGH